jgi:excinuclease UvrABC ATPase subunit
VKTKDTTKRKVTFRISEEEMFLFQSYFMFCSPCKKHQEKYDLQEIEVCQDCRNTREAQGMKLHEIGERVFKAYWKKYYKAPKFSIKEKQLLKIIQSKDWDIILFYEAMVKVGESLGLTHQQAEKALEKFEASGEIYYPKPGQIDCPKKLKDDPWKDLPETNSSEKVI